MKELNRLKAIGLGTTITSTVLPVSQEGLTIHEWIYIIGAIITLLGIIQEILIKYEQVQT